jgi:outer membrane protein TolC
MPSVLMMAGLILGLGPTAQAQTVPYTLGSAVDAVLRRNAGLAAAERRVDEAKAAATEARARRLPSLSANAAFTRSDNPVYAFGSLLNQRSFTQADFDVGRLNHPGYLSNFKSTLELGLPLFTAFELSSYDRLGQLGRSAAESDRDLAVQGTRYAATQAFLAVILQEGVVRTIEETVAASETEVQDARRLKERGLVLGSDYYAAEAILEGLRTWGVRSSAALTGAKSRLALLLGIAPQDLAVQGAFPGRCDSAGGLEEFSRQALESRPELRQAALNEEMAAVRRRKEDFSFLPKVDAFAALETDTRDFDSNPSNKLFGVRASLPLGDPSYWSRRARAEAALAAGRDQARQQREQVSIEVAQAYAGFNGACQALSPAQDAMEKGLHSLQLFRPLYREGRQSILDVLRAEEGLAKAKAAYLQTLYDIQDSRARLWLASGAFDGARVRDLDKGMVAP